MFTEEENYKLPVGFIASRVAESESSAKRAKLTSLHSQDTICPHCNQPLSAKTYKRHKKLFCKDDGTWITASSNHDQIIEGVYSYNYIAAR